MFGWLEKEVLGQPVPIFPGGLDRAALGIDLSTGPVRGIESVRIRKDGVRVPVRVWSAPISSLGGRLSMLTDLTEFREAQRLRADLVEKERVAQELAVTGQRFSLLLEAAPDAILEVDSEG